MVVATRKSACKPKAPLFQHLEITITNNYPPVGYGCTSRQAHPWTIRLSPLRRPTQISCALFPAVMGDDPPTLVSDSQALPFTGSTPWLPRATSFSEPPRCALHSACPVSAAPSHQPICTYARVDPDPRGPRNRHGAKPPRYAPPLLHSCSVMAAQALPCLTWALSCLDRQPLARPTTASTWPLSGPSTSPRSKRRSSRWRPRRFSPSSTSTTSSLSSFLVSRCDHARAQSISASPIT